MSSSVNMKQAPSFITEDNLPVFAGNPSDYNDGTYQDESIKLNFPKTPLD